MSEEKINKVNSEDLSQPEEEATPEEAKSAEGSGGGDDAVRSEQANKRGDSSLREREGEEKDKRGDDSLASKESQAK